MLSASLNKTLKKLNILYDRKERILADGPIRLFSNLCLRILLNKQTKNVFTFCFFSYVPWNLHEPIPQEYNFRGMLDIRFVDCVYLHAYIYNPLHRF